MGNKGGFILFLLVLAVLCHSDHSLTCSICTEPDHDCNKTTTCSVNLDMCLFVKAEPKLFYHQGWKFQGGTWVVQSIGHLTLGFSSGCDFMGCGIESHTGLCSQWGVSLKILSLCPFPHSHISILSFSL
uniref:Uncharacterized protein n=1 Tax=Neovison vison TaxID=452646 RepID=A0A8C7EJB2_NEOVI